MATSATYYKVNPKQGLSQFRYAVYINKYDYKSAMSIFNSQTNTKAARKVVKSSLLEIATNKKIYVPMIAKEFDIEESNLYDGLTNEGTEYFLNNPQMIGLNKESSFYMCHDIKQKFSPYNQVKIRVLCPFKLNLDFQTKVTQTQSFIIDKAIIHFHGGGFSSMDSFSH